MEVHPVTVHVLSTGAEYQTNSCYNCGTEDHDPSYFDPYAPTEEEVAQAQYKRTLWELGWPIRGWEIKL